MHLGGGHGSRMEQYRLTSSGRGEGRGTRKESQKLEPGELALDLLRLACLHESDFATLRLTSVAIHPFELFEIECQSRECIQHRTPNECFDLSIIVPRFTRRIIDEFKYRHYIPLDYINAFILIMYLNERFLDK